MELAKLRHLVIEGPIGVGKTSLAKRLAERLDHPDVSGELIRQAYADALDAERKGCTGCGRTLDEIVHWRSMTDAQRLAAITNNGNLHWTGANVQAASGVLTAGAVGTHVRMYAPTTYTQGSSVSHWDTALTPNQLMEPNYTGAQHVLGLELPMFRDLGWPLLETWSVAGTGNVNLDAFNDIFWRNTLDNTVAMWTINGASIASGPIIGGAPFEWKIVATGDFNGDGKSDVLWRGPNGEVSIWLMNGATVTAGGLVMRAMQDGDFIIYDDEQLQELYRFNLGTPLKGAPVTYAIGPKQYIAVQTSGRHLHPVKFDKLETSSYLFVFALN